MDKDNTNRYKSRARKRIMDSLNYIDDLEDMLEMFDGKVTLGIDKEIHHIKNRIRRLKEKYGI